MHEADSPVIAHRKFQEMVDRSEPDNVLRILNDSVLVRHIPLRLKTRPLGLQPVAPLIREL
jgi:hypothetical protein